jgi:hypothetical protein
MDLRQAGQLDSALLSAGQHVPLAPAALLHAGSRLAIEEDDEPGAIAKEHRGKGGDAAVGTPLLLHHPNALPKTKTYHDRPSLPRSHPIVRAENEQPAAE